MRLQHHDVLLFCAALAQVAVCRAGDDLRPLSDEFGSPATVSEWSRIHAVEQWPADQLEHYSIDGLVAPGEPGRMIMQPYTCTWFRDYRGPLNFKLVSGDFVMTTEVRVSGRDGVSVPQSQFSLAGIMARAPRDITPPTWTPGGENYVFLSLGYGFAQPRDWQYEVKTTEDGDSVLILSPAPAPVAGLQVARLGDYFIMLRRDGGGSSGAPWVVHRRYPRAAMPDELQVGLVTYTDWQKVELFDPFTHNGAVLRDPLPPGVVDPNPFIPFAPDLVASFDYARFVRPAVPPELIGADLSEGGPVSDAQLLAFLGEHANLAAPPACPGDASGDRSVGLADVAVIINCWSMPAACNPGADLDVSGSVGLGDVALVIQHWGAQCP